MEMELNRVCIQIVASVSGSRCFCLLSTSYEIRSERKMCAHSTQVLVHRSMNYTFDWVNNQIQCKTRFTFFFVAHTLSLSLTAKFQSRINSNRIRFLCFFFHQMWIFNSFSKILPLHGSDCWQSIYVHSRMRSSSWCDLKQSLCVHFIVSF